MSKSTTKQATKRKSQGALPDARSAKQPKLTIDSFFSRKVSVRIGSGLDGVAADAEEKVLDVVLSDEQVKVLKMVVEEGKNVFFTGSAGTSFFLRTFLSLFPSFHAKGSELINVVGLLGTGKSLLLKAIIMALKKKHASKPEVVSVTASTGMAASNIGGALRQIRVQEPFLISRGRHDATFMGRDCALGQ
jgi:hypothetical protein